MIAPHHGSSNGSCLEFIKLVDPDKVIFPAGHSHYHPNHRVYLRYKKAGLSDSDLFRTDRGDNEGKPEWWDGRSGCFDDVGDDEVIIKLRSNGGSPIVTYLRQPSDSCEL